MVPIRFRTPSRSPSACCDKSIPADLLSTDFRNVSWDKPIDAGHTKPLSISMSFGYSQKPKMLVKLDYLNIKPFNVRWNLVIHCKE
jgi:hypothetical protein